MCWSICVCIVSDNLELVFKPVGTVFRHPIHSLTVTIGKHDLDNITNVLGIDPNIFKIVYPDFFGQVAVELIVAGVFADHYPFGVSGQFCFLYKFFFCNL